MNYYKKIDGLRFVAITLVLIEHFASFLTNFFSAGYYGVDLFFVISGFLITAILLKQNDKSFKSNYFNFLGRRTLRIFPIYYFTLLLLWILKIGNTRLYMPYLVTYTANYGMIANGLPKAPILHLWSLSVEEQFYLFWPFVVLILKQKQVFLAILLIAIISVGYVQMIYNVFPSVTKYNYWGLFPRMSSLAMGGLGALIARNSLVPQRLFKSRMFEIFMLLLLITSLLISFPAKFPLLGLCSLYLVLKASGNNFRLKKLDSFLSNKFIIFVGTISYGIYLFHPVVEYLFTKYIFNPVWLNIDFTALGSFKKIQWNSWIIKFPLYSFLSILVASLSFKYIEQPILGLKNKLFPR